MASLHSPKNPYRVEVSYSKCLQFGSVISFTTETLEIAKAMAEDEVKSRNGKGGKAHIVIWHNKKTYPEFDWEIIEEYNI